MYLTGRERKIIEFLLKEHEDVSIRDIANHFDVSERTIHRDLKTITVGVENFHVSVIKKSGVGVRLTGTDGAKKDLLKAISHSPAAEFTPEERQAIILSTLLEAKEPIKLFILANELFVTTATISTDLDQIEDRIRTFNLQLVRRRGYGVKIIGKEFKKRAALSQIIKQFIEPYHFVALGNKTDELEWDATSEIVSRRLLESVDSKKIIVIQKVVQHAIKGLPHELADQAYIGLIVHLALALERLQKGESLTFAKDYLQQLAQTPEYKIAERIIQDLQLALSIHIPKEEIGYITMHLMGAKLQPREDFFIEDSSMDIAIKAAELIQFVGAKLDFNLGDDISLLKGLVAHLKPTVYRLKQEMPIHNPLLDDIRNDYQTLFQTVQLGVREIFPGLPFPDEEVGYLVLHFAATLLDESKLHIRALVICSSGIGTAKMLASKLLQRVPEIKQVENKSLLSIGELTLDDYDVVISTIPLSDIGRDYILTSPFPSEKEIQRIQKTIRTRKFQWRKTEVHHALTQAKERLDIMRQLRVTQAYLNVILDLLDIFQVKKVPEDLNMKAILQMICQDLAEIQVITDEKDILERFIERERVGGLGIPETGLALYHTRSETVRKPVFRIYSLEKPQHVMGMDAEEMKAHTIIIMLAPIKAGSEVLEVLSYISNLLIQREENVRLMASGDEQVIREFLTEQLQRLLKEKNLW